MDVLLIVSWAGFAGAVVSLIAAVAIFVKADVPAALRFLCKKRSVSIVDDSATQRKDIHCSI